MEDFQSRLKALMKRNNITIKKLGELSGVQPRTIEGWLSARKQMPKVDAAVSIALALGTSTEYLVTGVVPGNDEDISDIRRKFQQFIDESSDEDLQKLWDFMAVMRGRK